KTLMMSGKGKAVKSRPRNARNAIGTIGEGVPVDEDGTDDLAEGERHDRQIITAQAQDRKGKDQAQAGGKQTGERQNQPEGPWRDGMAEPERTIDGRTQRV